MKRKVLFVCLLFAMTMLILDNALMQQSVRLAMELCLTTVIPALLPFLVLIGPLQSIMSQQYIPLSGFLGKIMGISKEQVNILLLGLIGGYPMGARCIAEAVQTDQISIADGKRLLCFCSNAGPAFLFGMGFNLFSNPWLCWLAWFIQILSAFTIAVLIPGRSTHTSNFKRKNEVSLADYLRSAINTIVIICLWVILFRLVIAFLAKWVLWMFPSTILIVLTGLLELTNGCAGLQTVANGEIRFLLFSGFLSFGGICIAMQTHCITKPQGISIRTYLPAKLLQGFLSVLYAWMLYPTNNLYWLFLVFFGGVITMKALGKRFHKISTGNSSPIPV